MQARMRLLTVQKSFLLVFSSMVAAASPAYAAVFRQSVNLIYSRFSGRSTDLAIPVCMMVYAITLYGGHGIMLRVGFVHLGTTVSKRCRRAVRYEI